MINRERIIEVVADVYEEQKINNFRIDSFKLCKRMGIRVLKYSEYLDKALLLPRYDKDGLSLVDFEKNEVIIIYNDNIRPYKRIKFTIFHELGHICLGHHLQTQEETDEQKSEADVFANEFYCPQAFMIYYNIRTKEELKEIFDITEKYAEVLLDKLKRRRSDVLSKNEKRLINIFENNKK